ncbi:hypothetical protein KKD70_00845 [Patescibacteria group bacterium]|nr:hypothetical protein [Patescibacteria group bacterium]
MFNFKKSSDKDIPAEPQAENDTFTDIFSKNNHETRSESELLTGVLKKGDEENTDKEKILGPLPELQKRIIGSFDPSKRNLKLTRNIFISLLVVAAIMIGFFYVELNPDFDLLANLRGPNTAQKLINNEKATITKQTSINQKNYLLMTYYLQELSYYADTYARSRNDLSITPAELSELQENILRIYENIQFKWHEPLISGGIEEQIFQDALKDAMRNELVQLRKEDQTESVVAQLTTYETALRLINNIKFNTFLNKNPDSIRNELENNDDQLFALTEEILNIVQSDFSSISELKQSRIEWSKIVNEIEKITKSVDTLYNTGFFEELGGIQYSGYDFDIKTNRIILTGKAKRDNGSTFSLIANLIDAIEQSSMFENADNRSYPKSGSEEEGYISNFRIELSLEQ